MLRLMSSTSVSDPDAASEALPDLVACAAIVAFRLPLPLRLPWVLGRRASAPESRLPEPALLLLPSRVAAMCLHAV